MLTRFVLASSLFLLCGLAIIGWRNRSDPGAGVFGLLEAVSAVWVALTVVGLSLPPGVARLRVWGTTTALSLLVVLLWMAFILRYTGRDRWLRPTRFGVAAAPLLVGALLYGVVPAWGPVVGSFEQSTTPAGTIVGVSIGPVGAALGVYVYLVFLAGLSIVLKTLLEGHNRFVGQAMAFLLGTLVTVVASVGELAGVPTAGYPLTQATLGVQALLWGYAVFGQQFLIETPAVARIGERAVFDELDDGILVVDSSGTVTRANPRARTYLGADPVGASLSDLLASFGADGLEELPTRFRRRGRAFQVKASTVEDWRGETVGRALAVREVTGLARRQQRLEVLTRIMRHNLRNDMTVVRGYANEIRRRIDGEAAALSEQIVSTADGLLSISERAVALDGLFEEDGATTTIDVESFLERCVDRLAEEYPEASVDATAGAGELRTDARMLSLVVEEAVENALKHAGDAPSVEVRVEQKATGVRFVVADDGPGIPPVELEPVRSGTETDLQHATGLGLWLIRWGTRSLGGAVEFEAGDDGTTVTLTVPDESASADRSRAAAAPTAAFVSRTG
jgi:signal transduction histidine kinase